MKAFLDTSVLVPVFYADHPHHRASLDLFARLKKDEGCCGAHSLVEVYSAMTRMPGKFRVTGEQAMLFIGDIRSRLAVLALTADEYGTLLEQYSAINVTGGMIYDAVLAACALKSKAKTLYTWNLRHYERLGPNIARLLNTP
jgi:predicted nucleic acid-binding protein